MEVQKFQITRCEKEQILSGIGEDPDCKVQINQRLL